MWRRYCPVSRHYVRTKPWKVAVWCTIVSLGTIIPSLWIEEHLSFLPDLTNGMHGMFGNTLGYLTIAVCAPICEEVVFRGAVIRALMNWKPNWKLAVVISALLFSIAHMNPAQMPHAFLLGLLLGWVFVRTGSVVPGIIIHGVNNLTVYIIASSVPGIEEPCRPLWRQRDESPAQRPLLAPHPPPRPLPVAPKHEKGIKEL